MWFSSQSRETNRLFARKMSYRERTMLQSSTLSNEQMELSKVYPEKRIPVLEFLCLVFKALLVLNEAYRHMFSTPPPHPPCQHTPHQQGPGHLTDMAGQGGRMTFVGMLLRTTERIWDLMVSNLWGHRDDKHFSQLVQQEKRKRPEIAHGVAVLHFLTAGLCSNAILFKLVRLVQALKKASRSCEHHHCELDFFEFYKNNKSNCTLALIKRLLTQCTEANCDITCNACQEIQQYKAELEPHLDPRHWKGCADCESMIVDIIVYSAMFCNTERRMMASLRLSLKCTINLKDKVGLLKQLMWLLKHLHSEGFIEIQHHMDASGCSADYEVLFISGWQDDKKTKEPKHLMLEAFLERKNSKRLFFIQWKHQVIGKHDGQAHCCEPQMESLLKEVMDKVAEHHLARFIEVHMMMEQDPCFSCRKEILPAIVCHLGDYRIPPQLVSMLPFIPHSVFLERLTADGGPVQLKQDLAPFQGRHVCMIHRHCENVRCHTQCQYSKPDKILAVKKAKLRHHKLQISLEIKELHAIMWFVWCDT